jgi:hypothetical protein
MPLVLESEGPRLEGVEGEVSELGGEEKPSWGEGSGQPAGPWVCWPARAGTAGQLQDHCSGPLWAMDTGSGMSPAV